MQRFVTRNLFVFQLRNFKVGFEGPKTFRGFGETGPCSEGFFSGYSDFPISSETNIQIVSVRDKLV